MTLRVTVRDPVGRIVGVGELTDESAAQIGDTTVFVRCDYPKGPPLLRRPMEFVQVELGVELESVSDSAVTDATEDTGER